jgi:hypothetical protein
MVRALFIAGVGIYGPTHFNRTCSNSTRPANAPYQIACKQTLCGQAVARIRTLDILHGKQGVGKECRLEDLQPRIGETSVRNHHAAWAIRFERLAEKDFGRLDRERLRVRQGRLRAVRRPVGRDPQRSRHAMPTPRAGHCPEPAPPRSLAATR